MRSAGHRARPLPFVHPIATCLTGLLLCAGAVACPGSAAAATGGWVSGTVYDVHGQPAAGIVVEGRLVEDPAGELQSLASTEADGSWSSRRLPPGRYVLRFSDMFDRYAFQYYGGSPLAARATPVAVTDRTVVYDIDTTLRDGSRIKGVVRDPSGRPVQNANVDVFCPVGDGDWMLIKEIQGRRNGSYSVAGLAAGPYRLRFAGGKPRLGRVYYRSAPSFARGREVRVGEGVDVTGVNVALTRPAEVGGRVLSTRGRPLAGITVTAFEAAPAGDRSYTGGWVRTSKQGGFRVTGLGAGSYILLAYDQGGAYAPQVFRQRQIRLNEADEIKLSAGRAGRGVTFRLGRAGSVRGKVVDARRRPLNVFVSAYFYDPADGWWPWPYALTATNDKGAYKLAGLPPGPCRIGFTVLTLTGYQTYFYRDAAAVDAGTTVQVVAGRTATGIDQVIAEGVQGTPGSITGAVAASPASMLAALPAGPRSRSQSDPIAARLVRPRALSAGQVASGFTLDPPLPWRSLTLP